MKIPLVEELLLKLSSELLVLLLVKLDASSIGRLISELVTAIHSADESNLIERWYSYHSDVLKTKVNSGNTSVSGQGLPNDGVCDS